MDLSNNLTIRTIKTSLLSSLLLLITTTSSVMAIDVDLSGRTEKDLKRDITSKPAQIIEFAEVKSGGKVLDFLGGAGYYSEILKRVVGTKGSVVLQNNKAYIAYVGKYLAQREADGHLPNITQLISEADDLKLGKGQFDTVFLILGYHDFFHKDKGWDFDTDLVMPQVLKALKPSGKLLIIDHDSAKGQGINQTKKLHRIEASYVKTDLEKRGFKLVKQSDILRNEKDDHTLGVFNPEMRRKTDRFVMLFEKAK